MNSSNLVVATYRERTILILICIYYIPRELSLS